MEQLKRLHHPKPGDLLISAAVLARSLYVKSVGREVYQHTELSFLVYPFQKAKPKAK